MKIKRFNENENNHPSIEDIKYTFASVFDSSDEHLIRDVHIVSEKVKSSDETVWSIDPLYLLDKANINKNGIIINLGHTFYNPSSSMYNQEPSLEDFYKYSEMISDLRTSILSFKEEYPECEIRFDLSKYSWVTIQIKLFNI